MRSGEHDVARAYVLYREERARERAASRAGEGGERRHGAARGRERRAQGRSTCARLERLVASACEGLGRRGRPQAILESTLRDLYDGVPMDEVRKSAILAARALIEKDPAYSYVTARLLLHTIRLRGAGRGGRARPRWQTRYARVLPAVHRARHRGRAARPALAQFDLARLGEALEAGARPAVQLPRPADAVRPLLPAQRRPAHRAAAGVLHARGDGPGAERDRPRSARDRVLRRAVDASTS